MAVHAKKVRRKPMSEINVVPYIDVMLVLLVIFMITASLLTAGVVVELPQAEAEPMSGETDEPLVVTVTVNGDYYLSVGDTPDDVRAAVAAGVLPLGIVAPGADATKHGPPSKEAGAVTVLDDVASIRNLLQ